MCLGRCTEFLFPVMMREAGMPKTGIWHEEMCNFSQMRRRRCFKGRNEAALGWQQQAEETVRLCRHGQVLLLPPPSFSSSSFHFPSGTALCRYEPRVAFCLFCAALSFFAFSFSTLKKLNGRSTAACPRRRRALQRRIDP